ncbi:hypothetical protein [Aeromicrobium sp. NPDC092404]|uniref:hypothetical protein n=1 Tax=Aeromicrobium sp. NPDC092404 TaxID=3154976 RepID=UPI003439EB65
MTTPAAPAKRPGRGWYAVAAVLAVVAAATVVVLVVWIARAIAGYSVTPFEDDRSTTVTISERDVAIWFAPQDAPASCTATDTQTQESSISSGTASKVTITDDGTTWKRVGIVKGAPGSVHLVECDGGAQAYGYADNPRIGRYVLPAVAGGLLGLASGIAAFVIVLVVAIKRHRKPTPTA